MGYTAGQVLRASQLGPTPCTSTTRPASPHEGLLIRESDTGMLAIYSGSALRYLCPTGEVSTQAEYNPSGTQSIPNTTSTEIAFANESVSTALVTRSTAGAGHQFTLNRAGLWSFSLIVRTASGTGERHVSLNDTAGYVAAANVLGTGPAHIDVSIIRYFASGVVITPKIYQATGGALSTAAGTGETRMHVAWLHS